MLLQGTVGPALDTDGVTPSSGVRQGRLGDAIVSALHGRYYEQTVRRNIFTAYASAQATSLVGTAMVGLQLWNGSPVVGGVNLVLLKTISMVLVASASTTRISLATGTGQVSAPGSQTAITRVSSNYIGGTGPAATAMTAGTFTNAPTTFFPVLHNTAALGGTGEDPGGYIDLEGSIVIPPQCYFAFAAIGAAVAGAGADHAVMWEEVPV